MKLYFAIGATIVMLLASVGIMGQTQKKRQQTPVLQSQKNGVSTSNAPSAGTVMPDDPALSKAMVGEFVFIPAGEFMIGSNNEDDHASPVHRVIITKNFELGKYEVTQAEWTAIMGKNPSYFKGPNRPVEQVTWEEVQKFIQVLNSKSKNYSYRLPTEAEWEYACRAGGKENYGSNLESVAWFGNNSGKQKIDSDEIFRRERNDYLVTLGNNSNQTHPIGQKKPNGWGLYDMLGNVGEWCQDWFGLYPNGSQTDPQGPAKGSDRVERGASWSDRTEHCHSAFRSADSPGYRGNDIGFRLLRVPR